MYSTKICIYVLLKNYVHSEAAIAPLGEMNLAQTLPHPNPYPYIYLFLDVFGGFANVLPIIIVLKDAFPVQLHLLDRSLVFPSSTL